MESGNRSLISKSGKSNMATRGFLVRDQVRPVRYSSTKQSRTIKRKKKKPEWDVSIVWVLIRSICCEVLVL